MLHPMSLAEVAAAEVPARTHGSWQHFAVYRPPQDTYGPRIPVASECTSTDEDDIIAHMYVPYRPSEQTVAWIQAYHEAKSVEGPRAGTQDFWERRPLVSPMQDFWDTT